MEPTVIRGAESAHYEVDPGVTAEVLIDRESTAAQNLALGHISFAPGCKVPPHTRTVEEFVYVVDGTATILACGTKYILKSGDAIYLPPGTEHQHLNEDPFVTLRQVYIFSPPGPEQEFRKLHEHLG
jgi:quercetin dioxygenase-like cupin family protein